MAKFLFKFKKPIFGPFPQFWEQSKIFKKIGLSCATSQWLLAPWQNPEKSNDSIPRKHPDRWPGSKDGQTLFHGILPWGVASKTAINWHLKVKNIEYNFGLTNNYCKRSAQSINLFNTFYGLMN